MAPKFSRAAPSPRSSADQKTDQVDSAARSRPHVRYEIRLAYVKADEVKEKLLQHARSDMPPAS